MERFLVTITGPSGVGKSAVVQDIFRRYDNFAEAVSTTTRAPRVGEVEGVAYHFVTLEEFQARYNAGKFLEYVVFSGNHYGIELTSLEKVHEAGKIPLLVVEPHGAYQIRDRWSYSLLQIYMKEPSEAALRERMANRGDSAAQIERRRLNDIDIFHEDDPIWGRVIVNNVIEETSREIVEELGSLLH